MGGGQLSTVCKWSEQRLDSDIPLGHSAEPSISPHSYGFFVLCLGSSRVQGTGPQGCMLDSVCSRPPSLQGALASPH